MPLVVEANDTLDILVHNEGRICYGTGTYLCSLKHQIAMTVNDLFAGINDMKGILGNVTLNKEILLNWQMFPLDLPNFPEVNSEPFNFAQQEYSTDLRQKVSGFYSGKFVVERVLDTFLQVKGWTNVSYDFVGRMICRKIIF